MTKRAAAWLALCLSVVAVSSARAASPAAAPAPAAAPSAPPVSSYAPQPTVSRASIIGYTGSVSVERAKGKVVEPVSRLPTTLGPGDVVRVGPGSNAFLQFRDGSQTTVDQRARFSIEEDKPDAITVNLTLGKVWCAVSKLAGRRFLVRTPTAVAAVRGTEFTVESFGDKKSAVEVFGGLVSVRGSLGDEALVGASQRVESMAGRLAPVQRFEARPDPRMPPAKGPAGPAGPAAPGERKAGPPPPPGGPGAPGDRQGDKGKPQFGFNPDQLKNFVAREAGQFENQNQRESSAAFEQRNELYQAGKSLIDAFGRRVRVEEFITRPAPDAFKFVSVSLRDGRTDLASVEVKANAPLPANLGSVGSLFGAQTGANPPAFYAVQQRFSLRNLSTGESYVQLGVDGAPRQFNLPGQTFFDPIANAFVTPSSVFWKTMFGNSYEFQNGNQGAVDRIWTDASFRPFDNVMTMGTQVAGMTAHLQPVHVDIRNDPGAGNAVVGTYWTDAFVSRDPTDLSGTRTGLTYTSFKNEPLAGLSWTTKRFDYLDFTDTNSNGILDFGEALAHDGRFGGNVYHDIVERANGGALVAIAGSGSRQSTGDNAFSGKDAAGNPVNSGAILTYGAGAVNLSPLLNFGLNNARERLFVDDFVIDDLGKIVPAGANSGLSGNLLGRNYERRVRGTRFGGDIDVVVSPSFLIQSGAAGGGDGGGAVRAPGQPF